MSNIIGQTLLSQYRVDAFVASGGMGAVYRVWDMKRNVPLAMKTLHAELADDPHVFKRFQREAMALRQLRHPHIVPFYGLYQDRGEVFLLEAFVDGWSLQEIQREHKGALSLVEAMRYMKAVCSALAYAHQQGIVHCDIKPANIMVSRAGEIYLTDFGIAKFMGGTATTSTFVAGTPAYMAPEQIRGRGITPATDVYALGVMLFELLVGLRPFRGTEPETAAGGATPNERIRYGHLKVPPPHPSTINSAVSGPVAGVILRAMAKAPQERFGNAAEFFDALCNAAQVRSNTILVTTTLRGPLRASSPTPAQTRPAQSVSAAVAWRRPRNIAPFWVGGVIILFVIAGAAVVRYPSAPNTTIAPLAKFGSTITPGTKIFPGVTDTPILLTTATSVFTTSATQPLVDTATTAFTLTATPSFIPTDTPAFTAAVTPTILPVLSETPTEPPASAWIVFHSKPLRAGSNINIFAMDVFTREQRSLVADPHHDKVANWSRDGKYLVFERNGDGPQAGYYQIYMLDINRQETTSLTGDFENCSNWAPTWSPNGKQILFYSNCGKDKKYDLYLMNRNGSGRKKLLISTSGNVFPSWSPDGNWITFTSGFNSQTPQIFIAKTSGNQRFVAEGCDSTFSPDGEWLLFSSGQCLADGPIYRVRQDGSQLTAIGSLQGRNPSLSPNGKWLIFQSADHIWMANADGSNAVQLTSGDTEDGAPSWEP